MTTIIRGLGTIGACIQETSLDDWLENLTAEKPKGLPDIVDPEEMILITRYLMKGLSEHQQDVLKMRFGLEDGRRMRIATIAAKLELSQAEVKKTLKGAFSSMRNKFDRTQQFALEEDLPASAEMLN